MLSSFHGSHFSALACSPPVPQSPRYALVTLCEALQGFGATETALSDLPSVQACGLTLFLRSQGERGLLLRVRGDSVFPALSR